ncbi:hypothetical protein JMJ77_0006800, partial [Colletotrichum scovillei]
ALHNISVVENSEGWLILEGLVGSVLCFFFLHLGLAVPAISFRLVQSLSDEGSFG